MSLKRKQNGELIWKKKINYWYNSKIPNKIIVFFLFFSDLQSHFLGIKCSNDAMCIFVFSRSVYCPHSCSYSDDIFIYNFRTTYYFWRVDDYLLIVIEEETHITDYALTMANKRNVEANRIRSSPVIQNLLDYLQKRAETADNARQVPVLKWDSIIFSGCCFDKLKLFLVFSFSQKKELAVQVLTLPAKLSATNILPSAKKLLLQPVVNSLNHFTQIQ